MKFWKTGKIVKAISESDYQKLQRSRGRSTDQPGPSRPLPVIVSDSDSDRPFVLLVRKKRDFPCSNTAWVGFRFKSMPA